MTKYILAHDMGTSGDKASLFTTEGTFIATKTIGYPTNYAAGNVAEQDPEDWWKAFCESTKALVKGIDPKDVIVVAFDGTFPNCICLGKDGQSIHPCLIWQDTRATEEAAQASKDIPAEHLKYGFGGGACSPDTMLPKLMWLKKHKPDVFSNIQKVLPSTHNYIILKLSGNYTCDATMATSSNLVQSGGTVPGMFGPVEWCEENIKYVGLTKDNMPEIKNFTDIAGEVREGFEEICGLCPGTKLMVGTGDTQGTLVGAGVLGRGDAFMNAGTSAGIMMIPANESNPAPIVGGLTACSGSSFSWLKNNICLDEQNRAKILSRDVYDLINEQIAAASLGSSGVFFHPYLAGERAPFANPSAKGSFVGISLTTTRGDMLRSVIEGIGFNIDLILDKIRALGEDPKSMIIAGGLGKGDITRQIFADILNVELRVPENIDETATVGLAVFGGMAMGLWADTSAVKKFLKIKTITKPIPKNVAAYQKLKPTFKKIYDQLESVYPEM